MAKKEIKTDLWVYELLKEAGLNLSAQGSDIVEINNALKTASKSGTGKVGFPEYCGVVNDFLIVIEDKADTAKHIQRDANGLISLDTTSVRDFAVNGALHITASILQLIPATTRLLPLAYQAMKNATKSHRSLLTNAATTKSWTM